MLSFVQVLRKRRHDKWGFEQTLQDKLRRHGSHDRLGVLDLLSSQHPHGSPTLLASKTPSPSHPVEAFHNRAFRFDPAAVADNLDKIDRSEVATTPSELRGSRLNPHRPPPVLSTPVGSRSPAVSFHPPLAHASSHATLGRGTGAGLVTSLRRLSQVQAKLQETAPFTQQHDTSLISSLSGDQLTQSRRLARRKAMATALKAVLSFRLSSAVAPLEPSLVVDVKGRPVSADDAVALPPELMAASPGTSHDPRHPLADRTPLLTMAQRRQLRSTKTTSPHKRRASRRPSSPGKQAKRTTTPNVASPSSHETSLLSPLNLDQPSPMVPADSRAAGTEPKRPATTKTGRPRKKARAQPRTPKPAGSTTSQALPDGSATFSGPDYLAVLTSDAPSLEDLERLIAGDMPSRPGSGLSAPGPEELGSPQSIAQAAAQLAATVPAPGELDLDHLDLEELDIDLDSLLTEPTGQEPQMFDLSPASMKRLGFDP